MLTTASSMRVCKLVGSWQQLAGHDGFNNLHACVSWAHMITFASTACSTTQDALLLPGSAAADPVLCSPAG
jgi:hypothetical protein